MSYSAKSDVVNIWSAQGVTFRSDDNDDGLGDDSIVTAMIARADSIINSFALPRYTVAGLTGNAWTQWCSATLAAYFLGTRRGEPAPGPLEAEYQRYMENLKAVREGQLDIPLATKQFETFPVVSNMVIDGRYRRRIVRRDQMTSTGKAPASSRKSNPIEDANAWD